MKSASFASTAEPETEIASSRWSCKNLLAEAVRAWRLSPTAVALIFILPIFVAGFGAGTALMGKETYKWFTGEDRFAENLQVLFWSLTFLLGFPVMSRLRKSGERVMAVLYLLLNLGIFFLIGEEVSWGQRIFGWETGETMQAINKQQETNLHNIHGVGDTFKWVHVIIGVYGTLLPLLFMRAATSAQPRAFVSLLVPHYSLLLYFAATLLWRLQANLWKPPKSLYFVITEYSEVIELILALGFFFFMVFQVRSLKKDG